jgi:hypothetical protein
VGVLDAHMLLIPLHECQCYLFGCVWTVFSPVALWGMGGTLEGRVGDCNLRLGADFVQLGILFDIMLFVVLRRASYFLLPMNQWRLQRSGVCMM